MKSFINRHLSYAALFAGALALSACGGGGTSSTSTAGTATGSVALLVTDAPSDDFSAINLTVTRAELIGDAGRVTIFQGRETFNLLDLKNDARMFAVDANVPPGRYSKIRLTLDGIELVERDPQHAPHYPQLPGNGKLDLNARGGFYVQPGSSLLVQLDMDADKSILVTGNHEYQFRPVVFVDVMSSGAAPKRVRLFGQVEDLDVDRGRFKLCTRAVRIHHEDDREHDSRAEERCVKVLAGDASVFGMDGRPVTLASLNEGDPATVIGRLRPEDDDHDSDSDSDDRAYRSSHDEDDDRYDDDDDRHDDRDDDRYGDGYHDDDDREFHDMRLVASVIEIGPAGTFATIHGEAQGPVVAGQFDMLAADGTGVTVAVQEGTLVLSRKGDLLDAGAITAGTRLAVDGVRDAGLLRAALIVVDQDSSLSRLEGELGSGSMLMTDGGDRCITLAPGARIHRVYAGSDGSVESAEMDQSELGAGMQAEVYGREGSDGCFQADSIIVIDLPS